MKKVRYCNDQIKFLKKYFHNSPELTPEYRKKIEKCFKESFGFIRSSEALLAKARRMSFRPLQQPSRVVGKTISRNGGKNFLILVSDNPVKWSTVDRYKWGKETGEILTDNDIIINVKGVTRFPDFKDLRKVTKSESLKINQLSNDIPIETRILIAKIQDISSSLTGQGPWSSDEVDYLKKYGKSNGNIEFWKEFTDVFNLKFKKDRKHRQVLDMYYNKVGKYEKI